MYSTTIRINDYDLQFSTKNSYVLHQIMFNHIESSMLVFTILVHNMKKMHEKFQYRFQSIGRVTAIPNF